MDNGIDIPASFYLAHNFACFSYRAAGLCCKLIIITVVTLLRSKYRAARRLAAGIISIVRVRILVTVIFRIIGKKLCIDAPLRCRTGKTGTKQKYVETGSRLKCSLIFGLFINLMLVSRSIYVTKGQSYCTQRFCR